MHAQEYSINIYFRLTWHDHRLAFANLGNYDNDTMLSLDLGMWDKLWVPDVTFRNEKKAHFHEVTVSNRMMRLWGHGKVYYVIKFVVF